MIVSLLDPASSGCSKELQVLHLALFKLVFPAFCIDSDDVLAHCNPVLFPEPL